MPKQNSQLLNEELVRLGLAEPWPAQYKFRVNWAEYSLDHRRLIMLSPEGFYIDGRHNRSFLGEASDLVSQGLLSMEEGGDEQYTVYRYKPTAVGAKIYEMAMGERLL